LGILGSGLMGGKLGTLFARAGHDVVFSYARSEQKLKRLARNVSWIEDRLLSSARLNSDRLPRP
jgi:predicted dinucleotide-binding enzyme